MLSTNHPPRLLAFTYLSLYIVQEIRVTMTTTTTFTTMSTTPSNMTIDYFFYNLRWSCSYRTGTSKPWKQKRHN